MKLGNFFPVQKQVIPIIQDDNNLQSIISNDLCVLAPTGSGKTLTYVYPIVRELYSYIRPAIRAIILVPVGDLAEQVYHVVEEFIQQINTTLDSPSAKLTSRPIKSILLSNKTQFSREKVQLIDKEQKKCLFDIIISTPGRLVDHIQMTEELDLKELRFLVLDECDRLVENIKQNWLDVINQELFFNKNRKFIMNDFLNVNNTIFHRKWLIPVQKLLLSATLSRNPEKLEQLNLFQPLFLNINSNSRYNKPIKQTSSSNNNQTTSQIQKVNSLFQTEVTKKSNKVS